MKGIDSRMVAGIRYILLAILVVVMIRTQFGVKNSQTAAAEVEARVMASITDSDKMQQESNRMFRKIYGLNMNDYEDVIMYSPISGMAVEEILIIRLSSQNQADAVVKAIEGRVASQINVFEGYGIEQTALLKDAVIDARGNYVFYIVNENAKLADQAFRDSL